ncbi:flagellar protein FliT [Priestia koreensis]|nr:flagellar protein FliT [Priestia koreensis]
MWSSPIRFYKTTTERVVVEMSSSLDNLYDLTKSLYDHLQTPVMESEREGYIEKIDGLLEQREEILSALQPPNTAEEKERALRIIQMNEVIDEKLKEIKHAIMGDIRGLRMKKKQANHYANPYANLSSMDGTFYDKKK